MDPVHVSLVLSLIKETFYWHTELTNKVLVLFTCMIVMLVLFHFGRLDKFATFRALSSGMNEVVMRF